MSRPGASRTVAGIRPRVVRAAARPLHPMLPPRRADLTELPSRSAVLKRWEELEWWSCAYCDSPFGQMVVAEMDHIRPLAKGGRDEWANLNPSCRDCNRRKSDLDVDEWIAMSAGQEEAECDLSVTHGHC